MRRMVNGKRVCSWGSSFCLAFCLAVARVFFAGPVVSDGRVLSVAIHHCVNAIVASGSPMRNPRCGTSNAETALPQRHVVSGITVNDGGRSISTPKSPPSFVPAFSKSSIQPMPPFKSTINGVMIAASLSRNITSAQRWTRPTNASPRMKFSINIDWRKSAPHCTKTAETKSEMNG